MMEFQGKSRLIHHNQVQHSLAPAPIARPNSSFHRYVATGIYPADWGLGQVEIAWVDREHIVRLLCANPTTTDM